MVESSSNESSAENSPTKELPPSPDHNVVLVRYGEIGLKSHRVRARFERQLVDNLMDQLEGIGLKATVERPQGRVIVHAKPIEMALEAVSRTFGVVSYSPACYRPTSDRERVLELAVALAARRLASASSGTTFGVKVRRTGNHPFTSMELAGEAGAAILQAVPTARVQLKDPELQVTLEVRQNQTYGMVDSLPGVGGLPLGSQGRVAVLIDSADSVVAAWMLAKRGCRCVFLCIPGLVEKHWDIIAAFESWHPRLKLHELALPVSKAKIQSESPESEVGIASESPESEVGIASESPESGTGPESALASVYAESQLQLLPLVRKIALEHRAQALVLSWDILAFKELPTGSGIPIFYPLVGLNPDEVAGYREIMLNLRATTDHPLERPAVPGRRSRA